jgi:SAM-dependent methyltransferase
MAGWRGGEAHLRRRGEKSRIVRCRGCGLLFTDPARPPGGHPRYDDPDEYFSRHADLEARVSEFVSVIQESVRHGAREPLLDIGCGRGESLAAARLLRWEARGIEPSSEFAGVGARRLGVNIDIGTVEGRYRDSSFGLVLLAGVLEHVQYPAVLLREVRRLLQPGGVVYVDVPNERSLLHRCARATFLATGRNWTLSLSPTFPPYHVVGWSPGSLRAALELVGLDVLAIRGYPLRWIAGRLGYAVERAAAPVRLSAGLLAWARRPQPSER